MGIGAFGGVALDFTRRHRPPPENTDRRVLRGDGGTFDDALREESPPDSPLWPPAA